MDELTRRQGQLLIERGLARPDQLQQLAAQLAGRPGMDLIGLVVERGLLGASRAEGLRHQLGGHARPTPPVDHTHAPARSRVETLCDAYEQAHNEQPLIAPHADVVFEKGEMLGEGGMGQVWRVRDERLGRDAALKTLQPDVAGPRGVRRFLREARVMARLDHPNIPPVFEAGVTAGGKHFILMRLIRGETLDDAIREAHRHGPAPLDRLTPLLEALAKASEAIAHAHSRGIIHRDLKPENIMLGAFGEVMVLDWGLARALNDDEADQDDAELGRQTQVEDVPLAADLGAGRGSGDTRRDSSGSGSASGLHDEDGPALTRDGAALGTPGYMAPEQASGVPADARADIFALGVILTEILSGQSPLEGANSQARMIAAIDGRIHSPRSLRRSVPRDLDGLARAALRHNREGRLGDADQFALNLRSWLTGGDVRLHRYGLWERLLKSARRHPVRLVGAAALAMLLAVGGVLSNLVFASREAKRQAERSEKRLRDTLDKLAEARSLARRGINLKPLAEALDQALALGGRTEALLLEAASIYREADYDKAARPLLEEVARRFRPGYRALYELHGLELGNRQSFDLTPWLIELLKRAKARGDENEFTLAAEGTRLRQAGKLEDALERYNRIERYTTRFSRAYNNRGAIYLELNRIEEALKDFTRALELDPSSAAVLSNRAVVYQRLGRPEAALDDARRAAGLEPDRPKIQLNLAIMLADMKRFREALDAIERAVRLEPKDAEIVATKASLLGDVGRVDEAIALGREAIALDPKSHKARAYQAQLLFDAKRYEAAIEQCTEALKLDPDQQMHYRRGLCHVFLQNWREALDDFEACAKALEGSHAYHNSKGVALAKLGRDQDALPEFSKAIRLRDSVPNYYLNRASSQVALGLDSAAEADLTKAIQLDRDMATAYFLRASVRKRLGNLSGTRQDWQEFLRIKPSSRVAPDLRAAVEKLRAAGY